MEGALCWSSFSRAHPLLKLSLDEKETQEGNDALLVAMNMADQLNGRRASRMES